ncbi:hypothetical protein EJ05DRAFT_251817 [Pseudovirgaria hyperparasitica]|uniref:Uncharacterized protein n=1 Tax=Pseudovirgaria hyperparasitica TaxID=470096 RepID=A0A6A6WE35_9PEZI|nr:uncharacterized protein EJ05DRAFT_251817 [Pseudovirgaria hyperparasitica]KAF2761082.1 hypothetical protein EJ05DRAFT_251817 [Pseudovirgaria hyperparasitica]
MFVDGGCARREMDRSVSVVRGPVPCTACRSASSCSVPLSRTPPDQPYANTPTPTIRPDAIANRKRYHPPKPTIIYHLLTTTTPVLVVIEFRHMYRVSCIP